MSREYAEIHVILDFSFPKAYQHQSQLRKFTSLFGEMFSVSLKLFSKFGNVANCLRRSNSNFTVKILRLERGLSKQIVCFLEAPQFAAHFTVENRIINYDIWQNCSAWFICVCLDCWSWGGVSIFLKFFFPIHDGSDSSPTKAHAEYWWGPELCGLFIQAHQPCYWICAKEKKYLCINQRLPESLIAKMCCQSSEHISKLRIPIECLLMHEINWAIAALLALLVRVHGAFIALASGGLLARWE
jgi:hypothetical protein